MGLNKYKFGELLELTNEKNADGKYGEDDAIGVNIDKIILPMRGKISGKNFSKFHLVPPRHFAYNPRGSRKLGIGFNDTDRTFIITFNDNVFRIKSDAKEILLDTYLFMYLSRKEWDRYAEFISWGSSTEVFDWKCFCDEEILLPPINIQQKYVDVYNAILANQKSYERGLDSLKLTCDATIEHLKEKYPLRTFGEYIERVDVRNSDKLYNNVKNVSVYKKFGEVSSKVDRNNLGNYKVVMPREISFVQTTHNEKVFCNAMNNTDEPILVTSVNEVFRCDETKILPEYLCLNFNRTEFDRYARFHSWGSARETFTWADLMEVKIPLPPIEEQKSIVDIFRALQERNMISDKLKRQIKDICPILIKGSIEEARK